MTKLGAINVIKSNRPKKDNTILNGALDMAIDALGAPDYKSAAIQLYVLLEDIERLVYRDTYSTVEDFEGVLKQRYKIMSRNTKEELILL